MKMCLIAPIPPFRGGIAKYCYSLAQELEKRHDLLLLSYRRQYPELLYGRKSQIDPEVDKARIQREFCNLSYDIDSMSIFSWVATATRIVSFAPDLVIFPWWVTYWAPMYAYLLAILHKKEIKVVFLCINIFEHEDNALKKMATRFILRRANTIIVHSELEKETAREINPAATVIKHLLPLFVYDTCDTYTVRPDNKGLRLLFFGFVRPYKGLDVLLKAVALLKDQDISLKIAGEFWNETDEYNAIITEGGISDKVEIINRFVPDQEMSSCFASADLVVLPYRKSITSGIIATAYGFKKPVLATHVGGFHEVIQDGLTGKLVPPDDPEAFAEGILWFMAHQEIDFAENIASFTAREMSWNSLAGTLEGTMRDELESMSDKPMRDEG
ncbi:MAG: glycosyltransferase [Desulfuromonadaceae bacterium]|nr:glycosyltransferase [Desulfuromonadaceae bacterium]MDD5106924.1 glycosyltransferase [Desulfuromonadaceae bacterium]